MPSDLTPEVLAALPGLLDAATLVKPLEWTDHGCGIWSADAFGVTFYQMTETRHGLMDCIDNSGKAYQSQYLWDLTLDARAALAAYREAGEGRATTATSDGAGT